MVTRYDVKRETSSSPGVSLENEMDKPRDLGTARLVKRLISKNAAFFSFLAQIQYNRMICVERRSADITFEFAVGVVTLMGVIHAIGHFSFVFSSTFRSF